MERIICVCVGYIFGMIQTAYIIGRFHHIDIREHGSGNAGTTNALRTLGKRAGLIVFVCDMLKAIIGSLLVRLVFREIFPESITLLVMYTGLGAVLGHNFPAYLKFKGGKGIAVTGGFIISLGQWELIVVGLIVFVTIVAITRYVSLGSLVLVFVELVTFALLIYFDRISGLSSFALEIEAISVFFVFVMLAFIRHRTNIVRLFKGTENKLTFKKKAIENKGEEENHE